MNYLKDNLSNVYFFYRGRVGLYALLKAMKICPGDEVILQAFTCMAVPTPIVSMGAVPIYIDISPTSFNMDIDILEHKITKRTRVIIVQHTFGIPANMPRIMGIARKHNLFVIEDCCHALGSKYCDKEVGTFADASFHSYEWGKPVVIGLGGTVWLNNQDIKNEMEKEYKNYVYAPFRELIIIEFQYLIHSVLLRPSLYWLIKDIYHYFSKSGMLVGTFREAEWKGKASIDYNKYMFARHKERLLKKLAYIDKNIDNRVQLASFYQDALKESRYQQYELSEHQKPVYLRYPLLFDKKDLILKLARDNKIEISGIYASPVHPLKGAESEIVGYRLGMCPIAEKISREVISLPVNEKVKKSQVDRTIAFLKHLC